MHPKPNRPIGIFDSGIGGLTVANAICHLMPNESIVYFGDTAHFPYGEKSLDLIRNYALKIADYLIYHKHCKALVIACNTASAAAYQQIRNACQDAVPIINVIDPMVEYIVSQRYQDVGIIATRGTIDSGVYQEKISRRAPHQKYSPLATPLLASMIEEKLIDNDISHAVIQNYLQNPILSNIDALVLGCTHYPLIEKEIESYFNGRVTVLNSAKIVAEKLKQILINEALLTTNSSEKTSHEFFVSDLTDNFKKSTALFFGREVSLSELILDT